MKHIKITIEGAEYNAAINLASHLAMKRAFGKNTDEFDLENDTEAQLKFIYAVLRGNNPATFKYTFDEFLIAAEIDTVMKFSQLFEPENKPKPEKKGNARAAKP